MPIRIVLYGIPRERAGVAEVEMPCAPHAVVRVAEVLAWLRKEFPAMAAACIAADDELARGYMANINGACFVTSSEAQLVDGDTLLLMSADAGG